jgi:site-specific DNA-methyltransferase (adenine-specific)
MTTVETMRFSTGNGFAALENESRDAIVVSTHFVPGDGRRTCVSGDVTLTESASRLCHEACRILKFNGLLWIYGPPDALPHWGVKLSESRGDGWQLNFKYWFALDLRDTARGDTLKSPHMGMLLFIKAKVTKRIVSKLELDTDAVRLPHLNCSACGNTLKDWGGKRHLMNPKGAAISDVWRDLPRRKLRDNVIPADVLDRVGKLCGLPGGGLLHIVQTSPASSGRRKSEVVMQQSGNIAAQVATSGGHAVAGNVDEVQPDTVHHGDCVAFLNRVAELHPDGLFDLAFADPPYNLAKDYGDYEDALADQRYLDWCDDWLEGMAHALKPGGSLLVLNLPKWTLFHAVTLKRLLEFRHWIVWDALSDPRGKIMPAHYGLLWFTKPGTAPLCNYSGSIATASKKDWVQSPVSPKYCLRAACIRDRMARGVDARVELTDIWSDLHRIKHKRDRDAHPCQLPEKFMERIIKLTTNPGGWVFDPFGGAGTSAIAARKLGRKFVITEMDARYVEISRRKLADMKSNLDLFGELVVPRSSTARPRGVSTKREVELYLQSLARRLGRMPEVQDIKADDPTMLAKMDAIYPTRSAALKRAKIGIVLDSGLL